MTELSIEPSIHCAHACIIVVMSVCNEASVRELCEQCVLEDEESLICHKQARSLHV